MTPSQLIALVAEIRIKTNQGVVAWRDLDALVSRVETRISQGDPLNVPLTQAQVDAIVAVYSPLYTAALTAIEQASDALGTDVLS